MFCVVYMLWKCKYFFYLGFEISSFWLGFDVVLILKYIMYLSFMWWRNLVLIWKLGEGWGKIVIDEMGCRLL